MEFENNKIIRNFIDSYESDLIIEWIEGINQSVGDPNSHLSYLFKSLNGNSYLFDISKSDITKYITKFQSINIVSNDSLPKFVSILVDRVSNMLSLPTDHIFLQAVDMYKGGKISPHYDASVSGFINYKCNICILSDSYDIYIGRSKFSINEGDLYCFEASLYRHWTNEFNSRRVFLSIGFMVPYSHFNWDFNDPRIRMSERIQKYFQK